MSIPKKRENKNAENLNVNGPKHDYKRFSLKRGFPIWWKGNLLIITIALILLVNKSSWTLRDDFPLIFAFYLSEGLLTILFIAACFKGKS